MRQSAGYKKGNMAAFMYAGTRRKRKKKVKGLQFDEAKGYARGVEYVAEIIRSHMDEAKDINVPSNVIAWKPLPKPYKTN